MPKYCIRYRTQSGHFAYWPEEFWKDYDAYNRMKHLVWASYERPEVVRVCEVSNG